jgi:hypothetical protein
MLALIGRWHNLHSEALRSEINEGLSVIEQ